MKRRHETEPESEPEMSPNDTTGITVTHEASDKVTQQLSHKVIAKQNTFRHFRYYTAIQRAVQLTLP